MSPEEEEEEFPSGQENLSGARAAWKSLHRRQRRALLIDLLCCFALLIDLLGCLKSLGSTISSQSHCNARSQRTVPCNTRSTLQSQFALRATRSLLWQQNATARSAERGGLDQGGLSQRIAKGAGGKGPRQKTSKIVKKCQKVFRQFSATSKNVKNRQKVSKCFSTLFDNFRAAPFFRPLLQSTDYLRGGLNTVSESMASNTEVSELFGPQ